MNRRHDLDRFYELLSVLSAKVGGPRRLGECSSTTGWPSQGVYFFFEPGELRESGQPRVVRVGTHAVSIGSKTTLWNRLSAHRGTVGGARPGGGNHRGSIFRLHVGRALLARGDIDTEAGKTWGVGGSAAKPVREAEYPIEQAVSRYICAMPLLWLDVTDPAGTTSERKLIEANAIALLSNRDREPIDAASANWLGHLSTHQAIGACGLWNVHHVDERHDPGFLDVLDRYVVAMGGSERSSAAG